MELYLFYKIICLIDNFTNLYFMVKMIGIKCKIFETMETVNY